VPRVIRTTLISLRDLTITAGPFALLALALLVIAYVMLDPAPPKRVVLATGPLDSAYGAFGKRYVEALKPYGIEVVLKPSAGAAQNLRLLREGKESVDLAFVRGGTGDAVRAVDEDTSGVPLVSLGSLFFEPVWVFYREEAARRVNSGTTLTQLSELRGWKVDVGSRGSGVPNVMAKLLGANGIERESLVRSHQDLTPAVMALIAGELDALVMASAPEASMVQMLLHAPGVKLMEFPQAEAYARQLPFLSPVRLPRGIADLAMNVPSHDVPLVATTTMLVARQGTHPALQQLFVQAASTIHGAAGWLGPANQFPSPQQTQFPVSGEAARYYRNGTPLMQHYLPFWLANLIDRMWVAGLSIIAILIPVTRFVPPLYTFRVRSRVFRWYRHLREIEDALAANTVKPADLLRELNELDDKTAHVVVPLSFTDELYALRSYIQLVRDRLQHRLAQAAGDDAPR
jgi:TRAP-type uncharacterized transport system substrate-binding protein